jgi:RecA/RadA recombinase
LRDLGPWLRRGQAPAEPRRRLPTGLPAVDRLLGGGFPRGGLSEVAGPLSSGRTSLALALLARATAAGEVCALADAADGFDPPSAAAAGVTLSRVLWARPSRDIQRELLRATRQLLEAGGFALVLLQLADRGGPVPSATWRQLARAAAGSSTALVVLSLARQTGSCAEVALEMGAARARFRGTPALLEALETEAVLVRHRSACTARAAPLRLGSSRAA